MWPVSDLLFPKRLQDKFWKGKSKKDLLNGGSEFWLKAWSGWTRIVLPFFLFFKFFILFFYCRIKEARNASRLELLLSGRRKPPCSLLMARLVQTVCHLRHRKWNVNEGEKLSVQFVHFFFSLPHSLPPCTVGCDAARPKVNRSTSPTSRAGLDIWCWPPTLYI